MKNSISSAFTIFWKNRIQIHYGSKYLEKYYPLFKKTLGFSQNCWSCDLYFVHLLLHGVGRPTAAQPGERLESAVGVVLAEVEVRRLRHEGEEQQEDDGRDEVDDDEYPVGDVGAAGVLDHVAADEEEREQRSQSASDSRLQNTEFRSIKFCSTVTDRRALIIRKRISEQR